MTSPTLLTKKKKNETNGRQNKQVEERKEREQTGRPAVGHSHKYLYKTVYTEDC